METSQAATKPRTQNTPRSPPKLLRCKQKGSSLSRFAVSGYLCNGVGEGHLREAAERPISRASAQKPTFCPRPGADVRWRVEGKDQ